MNGLRKKQQSKKDNNLIFTRETLGVVLILFATLSLVCLITREAVFAGVGKAVNSFLFGCFGFFAYGVILALIGVGVYLISGKKIKVELKYKVLVTAGFIVLTMILQIITASKQEMAFGEYVSFCYNKGQGGITTASAGGVVTGMLTYAISSLLTDIGSYVILGLAFAGIVYLGIQDFIRPKQDAQEPRAKFRSSYVKEENNQVANAETIQKSNNANQVTYQNTGTVSYNGAPRQKLFINDSEDFVFKNKREMNKEKSNPYGMKIGFSQNGLGVVANSNTNTQPKQTVDYQSKLDYIKTPTTIDVSKYSFGQNEDDQRIGDIGVSDYITTRAERNESLFSSQNNANYNDGMVSTISPAIRDSVENRAERFNQQYFNVAETDRQSVVGNGRNDETVYNNSNANEEIPFIDETNEQSSFGREGVEINDNSRMGEQQGLDGNDNHLSQGEPSQSNITANRRIREIFEEDRPKEGGSQSQSVGYTSRVQADNNQSSRRGLMFDNASSQKPVEQEKPKVVAPINRKYIRPPFDLLENYVQPMNAGRENHEQRKQIIQKTLEEFHINAVPQGHIQGPSVTRYEIMMPAGISVKKVLNYDDDLKMRLAAKNGVRIEAPIPGKNLVGIEVANTVKVTVGLREVMEGLVNKRVKTGALMFALGKDIVGNSISDDLTKGPHYLIAGATGSGKSVCLHVMIVSLLMRYSPEELKLVLVDPKSVEFRKYEHIPHLLVDEIVTEPKRALTLLQWAYDETNRRNEMFTASGGHISNIDDYNTYIANSKIPKLPRIVFVIDELADLMEACKKDLEARIRMIAAKSRSAGIHLVLATQRPSVDVITGTIKANLPSRIALKVMNFADSQTILGEAGAEKLLGNGDMLYKNSSMGDYERYQGAYISGREIANVVDFIKKNNAAYFDDDIMEFLDKETRPKQEESTSANGGGEDGKEMDSLFLDALWTGVNSQTISISSLQRRFQIGYARAGGLVDKMEQMGFVSAYDGSKARKVLLSKEDFIERFGPREESY